MVDSKLTPKKVEVGGHVFEELAFDYIEKKYNISKEDLLKISEERRERRDTLDSLPVSILRAENLSSLESIVKFLRENRSLSYSAIAKLLDRNPKTLAVTYNVARRKMPKSFDRSIDEDKIRIPFNIFTRKLSVLECICVYLKSQNNSYAQISRMMGKDQRTIWTVCHRADSKLAKENDSSKERTKDEKG